MQRLQAQIENVLNSSGIVADAREMGFQERKIRKAIKRRAAHLEKAFQMLTFSHTKLYLQ